MISATLLISVLSKLLEYLEKMPHKKVATEIESEPYMANSMLTITSHLVCLEIYSLSSNP